MIGAILGDIIGSRFEFHNYLGKDFELLTPRCEFTDDTVMTCAVAQALMDSKEDFSDLSEKTVAAMQRIGRQYPNCGYGARFIHARSFLDFDLLCVLDGFEKWREKTNRQ